MKGSERMRKTALFLILIITLAMLMVGCSSKPAGDVIEGTALNLHELPQELQPKIDQIKETETYTAFNFNDYTYLVAAWGEKMSGGYTVKITEIQEVQDTLEATLEFTEPGEGESVTTAITYPLAVTRVPQSDKSKVVFKSSGGEELAAVAIETFNPPPQETSVNLYFGTESGETMQENRSVAADFREMSPAEQAEILLAELKKGSQASETNRFSVAGELLEKIETQDISYNESDKILTVTLSEKFLEIPEIDRELIAESVILTFTFYVQLNTPSNKFSK